MFFRSAYKKQTRNRTEPKSCTVNGAMTSGIDGIAVEVQAVTCGDLKEAKSWKNAVSVSGMSSTEASDMLTRVGAALASWGARDCDTKIVLNFYPEASGSGLDLPVAIALLQAAGYLPVNVDPSEFLLFGALDAHGNIRSTTGALSLCYAAADGQKVICPDDNASQCLLAKVDRECTIHPAADLMAVGRQFSGLRDIVEAKPSAKIDTSTTPTLVDFADIIGQVKMKRAMEIAAAGSHGILTVGRPGTGKTMSASALAGILPPLSDSEKVELTRIWSSADMLENGNSVESRPFRAVHHSATKQAIVGGGSQRLSIGEVTLAHRGVLFLDEVAEFRKDVLESLRQPMEDGMVRVSRVGHKVELPSKFSLIAAMNPCPCGYYPGCDCSKSQVKKYQSKISGPLMDRIDMKVCSDDDAEPSATTETSEQVRTRVRQARDMQANRLAGTGYECNGDVPGHKSIEFGNFSKSAEDHWHSLSGDGNLSMRLSGRVARVARTIADLEGSNTVEASHVDEAFVFSSFN